ncbi:CPBP family intramembrane glutamic endopeptidase [Teredinibacter turnerae]|uniref:CPBP family intramembrane glutamic endopeptidase n=1 Tax=Teredinibacter turnerae TaxID=2426 RepID=UPI0004083ADA|nr:CPBP family intramembrane glutamic endopeptidase [Teredinibacter turnerae]
MEYKTRTIITLLTFTGFLVAFYLLGYWLIFRTGQATPLMLSVGLATLATCLVRRISIGSLGWHWGEWKAQWQSYFTPFAIILAAYLMIWFTGLAGFYNSEYLSELKEDYNLPAWNELNILLFHVIFVATISFFVSLPSILGEEIGWRGLVTSELSKITSFGAVALISGVAWSIFHWPLIIRGLYGNGITPLIYQLFIFSLFIVSTSVIMTYYRLKTGSVWTGVIYHASSNIFIQKVFTPLTVETSRSAWFIDEFGAIPAVVAFCVALVFWRKGKAELSTSAV